MTTPDALALTHHPRVFANNGFPHDHAFRVICNCGTSKGFDNEEAANAFRDAHQALHPVFVGEEVFKQRLERIILACTNLNADQLQIVRDEVNDLLSAALDEEEVTG